jgi:rRNA maturation RNase YbeY
MAKISFFKENIDFNLPQKTSIKTWIQTIINQESNKKIKKINFIFCNDTFLHTLNKNYLQHDSLTDILTFDYAGNKNTLESEIYISIDRIRENSKQYNTSFSRELHRVMAHGILHLLGFDDKTEHQRQKMHEKENQYLNLYQD